MPRRPRLGIAGIPFHVIQRGNNRSPCFFEGGDYHRYLVDLERLSRMHGVAVHAYVLMTNHVHLLVTAQRADGVSQLMKQLGQGYTQYVNRRHERTGSLWDGRFRSCLVDTESYFLTCHRYIETNPVRAGMVGHPAAYLWSSYRANAEGVPNSMLSPHEIVEALGNTPAARRAAYRELFCEELGGAQLERIRRTTNGGFALGTPQFEERMAKALGRRVCAAPVGRKKKAD
ncbi:MAG: transposase [Gammaproteobacteria bacterium]